MIYWRCELPLLLSLMLCNTYYGAKVSKYVGSILEWPDNSKGEQERGRKMRHTYHDERIDSDLLPTERHLAFCFPSIR
eukprot:scaffold1740_cov150-Skeletonema_dohrnii-CCMP3373.AAC.2